LFQYTAIDCCTRVRLVQFSEELTAQTSAAFAQYVLTTFPFPVRCVQTDNDPTFTHWDHRGAQDAGGSPREAPPLHPHVPAVRGAPPAPPAPDAPLNGKVERSHQTDEQEFYRLRRSGTRAELQRAFARWLWHYKHTRIHLGLDGRTPFEALRAFPEYKQLKGLKCYPC
jgi:transposase InsO family protein